MHYYCVCCHCMTPSLTGSSHISLCVYILCHCFLFLYRTSSLAQCGGALMRKLDPSGKLCRSNLTRRATNLSNTVEGWAHTAVNTVRKPN